MAFEDWMGEIQSFLTREERVLRDLVTHPDKVHENQMENIKDWMRMAYEAGKEDERSTR